MVAVDDDMKSLLKAQEARVRRVQRAFQAAVVPSTQDFKSSIRINLIKDNEVATEDVNLAEKVSGSNDRSLKDEY